MRLSSTVETCLIRWSVPSWEGAGFGGFRWQSLGLPMALCTACACCGAGVRRAHLVDASIDGALLLELYSPEGATNAAMVSSDFYQVRAPFLPGVNKYQLCLLGTACLGLGHGSSAVLLLWIHLRYYRTWLYCVEDCLIGDRKRLTGLMGGNPDVCRASGRRSRETWMAFKRC